MNFINLSLIVYGSITCDCEYKGSFSKMEWVTDQSKFVSISFDSEEESLYAEFFGCQKKKKSFGIHGKVNDQDSFIGNAESVDVEITVLRCSENGEIQEEIMVTNRDGIFDFQTPFDKNDFLIFIKKGENTGVRYDIKSFKRVSKRKQ